MLPPSALSNMMISDTDFMCVAQGPAIVNHIFAELQLHLSVTQNTAVLSKATGQTATDANEPKHFHSAILAPVPPPLYSVIIQFHTSFTHSASAYNEIHHCVQSKFGLQIMQHNICTYEGQSKISRKGGIAL
jgi:hypothetical protein